MRMRHNDPGRCRRCGPQPGSCNSGSDALASVMVKWGQSCCLPGHRWDCQSGVALKSRLRTEAEVDWDAISKLATRPSAWATGLLNGGDNDH